MCFFNVYICLRCSNYSPVHIFSVCQLKYPLHFRFFYPSHPRFSVCMCLMPSIYVFIHFCICVHTFYVWTFNVGVHCLLCICSLRSMYIFTVFYVGVHCLQCMCSLSSMYPSFFVFLFLHHFRCCKTAINLVLPFWKKQFKGNSHFSVLRTFFSTKITEFCLTKELQNERFADIYGPIHISPSKLTIHLVVK